MKSLNNKNKIIILAIITLIIIGISIFLILNKNNNNSDINDSNSNNNNEISTKYEKIDKTKDLYYINHGNNYETNFYQTASFNYPVININTESVKNLNDYIKNLFDDLETSYKNFKN